MRIAGKRFIFGIVAVICTTVAACYLNYDGEIYFKIIGVIVGLYVGGQTITDTVKREK